MSLNGLIDNQIKQSGNSLKQVSEIAGYLVGDALLRIDSMGIEPVYETDFALLSASTMVEQATSTQITDSEIFLNSTTERIREDAHKIVGHSPDIISDIADAIAKPVKDIIDGALKPIQDTIGGIIKSAQSAVDNGVKMIKSGFDNAAKTITTWVDDGFKFIGEGVNFIQKTVNNLLEGVINVFDWAILALQKGFSSLTEGLLSVLSFEVEDVFKLTDQMTKKFTDKQTDELKKQAGGF